VFESGDLDGLTSNLEELVTNRALREKLAAGALHLSHSQVSVERFVDRMSSLYASLLTDRKIPLEKQELRPEEAAAVLY